MGASGKRVAKRGHKKAPIAEGVLATLWRDSTLGGCSVRCWCRHNKRLAFLVLGLLAYVELRDGAHVAHHSSPAFATGAFVVVHLMESSAEDGRGGRGFPFSSNILMRDSSKMT